MPTDLSEGDVELLIEGLTDDLAFVYVLSDLGLRGDSETGDGPPSPHEVDAAFEALTRLSDAGLVRVGRLEYVDGGPSGRMAPVEHVEEPIDQAKSRVQRQCRVGKDWEWACWVVNTPEGDVVARSALERER